MAGQSPGGQEAGRDVVSRENSLYSTNNAQLVPRRADLFTRIRALTPRMTQRERALFGLVWLQLDLLDDVPEPTAHWTLSVLDQLVWAFETAEAPAATEPP